MNTKRIPSLKTTFHYIRIILSGAVVIAGLSAYFIAAARVEKQVNDDLLLNARVVSNHFVNFFDELELQLQLFASSREIEDYENTTNYDRLLYYFIDNTPSIFASFYYVNTEGMEKVKVVNGQRAEIYYDLSTDIDYLNSLKKTIRLHVSSPRFDKDIKQRVLFIDYKIVDDFDDSIGFLRAALPLKYIAGEVKNALIREGRMVYIIDHQENLIYGETDDKLPMPPLVQKGHPLWAVYAKSVGKAEFMQITPLYGEDALISATPLSVVGWKIYIAETFDEAMKGLNQLRYLLIGASFLFIVFCEFLSRILRLRIIEPINILAETTAKITASGSLGNRVEVQSNDEIGRMAANFNTMLDKVEDFQVQLGEEKQFIENIVTSMADTLVVVDTRGVILKLNHPLTELLGYAERELLGSSVDVIFPDGKFPVEGTVLTQMNSSEVLRLPECLYLHRDGTQIDVSMTISVLTDERNTANGLVLIGTDIREMKKLEQQREKAQRRLKEIQTELLQTEKLAVVGQMSGLVAHEVLNPMSAINVRVALNLKKAGDLVDVINVFSKIIDGWEAKKMEGGFVDYLNSSGGSKDLRILSKIALTLSKNQTERVEDFAFIEKLVQRVIKTIDGLREISKQKKEVEQVHLERLVDEVVSDMTDGLEKRGIHVKKHYGKSPVIAADYMEIYSVVSNIMRNAMQAIDRQKAPAAKEIHVSLLDGPEDKAVILIQDTGIGMDAKTIKNVFTPGFTNKGREGTGIGMSFSRKIATQYGGDIVVINSELGKGTTFQITLGAKKEDKQQ